jgi:ribonuclease-3
MYIFGHPFKKQVYGLIGIKPGKIRYYKEAFIPKSSVPPNDIPLEEHQERLEFLGDAILEAVISDYLFRTFPSADEGFLSKVRAKIVNRESLNQLGQKLHLADAIKPPIHQNQHKKDLLGNTLEALIGAIFLDKGFRTVRQFILDHLIGDDRAFYRRVMEETDFKSLLVEWGQKNKEEIDFQTTEIDPSSTVQQAFSSQVRIGSVMAGQGSGASKKEAEQNAARKALGFIQKKYHPAGGYL